MSKHKVLLCRLLHFTTYTFCRQEGIDVFIKLGKEIAHQFMCQELLRFIRSWHCDSVYSLHFLDLPTALHKKPWELWQVISFEPDLSIHFCNQWHNHHVAIWSIKAPCRSLINIQCNEPRLAYSRITPPTHNTHTHWATVCKWIYTATVLIHDAILVYTQTFPFCTICDRTNDRLAY